MISNYNHCLTTTEAYYNLVWSLKRIVSITSKLQHLLSSPLYYLYFHITLFHSFKYILSVNIWELYACLKKLWGRSLRGDNVYIYPSHALHLLLSISRVCIYIYIYALIKWYLIFFLKTIWIYKNVFSFVFNLHNFCF